MTCPHCGKEIDTKDLAKMLRAIPSEKRTEASRQNGKKGGRPRKLAVGDNLSPTDMYKNSRNVSKLATVALIIGNVF